MTSFVSADEGDGEIDLSAAAETLGITEETLINALDDPPPDLAAASEKLGITEKELINALGVMPQEMEEAE